MSQENWRDLPDVELVRQSLLGKKDAFVEIIKRYQKKAFGMAFFHCRNKSEAEDLTQEIFLSTYSSLSRFDQTRSFTNWFLRIVTNHCLNYAKKKRNSPLLVDVSLFPPLLSDPAVEQIAQEQREKLFTALNQINEDFRLPLWLFYFFDRSYEQISEILEIPINLVKVRLFRGKLAIGKLIKKGE
ncbi:RNA polymerase sigma factor [bacterium]|nr:RNA polymerase sigma factor [bacterium]